MQKCVTIYRNIRTTHKYGNILQMKIEKYNYRVHIYIKFYPQLDTNRHHISAKIYQAICLTQNMHICITVDCFYLINQNKFMQIVE
jgi:hypothetical protein